MKRKFGKAACALLVVPVLAVLHACIDRSADVRVNVRLPDSTGDFAFADPFRCVKSLRATVRVGTPGDPTRMSLLSERFYEYDPAATGYDFDVASLHGGRDRFLVLEGCLEDAAALEAGAACTKVSRGSTPRGDYLPGGAQEPPGSSGRNYSVWLFFGRIGVLSPVKSRLNDGHAFSSAVDLENGKIAFVAGLATTSLALSGVEVFDVDGYDFTRTGQISTPRVWSAGAKLPEGGALVAGGMSTNAPGGIALATGDLIDKTGAPVPLGVGDVPPMLSIGRVFSGAARFLFDGKERTLVVGGAKIQDLREADGATDLWNGARLEPFTGLNIARSHHTITPLGDAKGRVLIAGGYSLRPIGTSFIPEIADTGELLDGSQATPYRSIGPMLTPRWGHAASRLRDGSILLTGGSSLRPDDGSPVVPALLTTSEHFVLEIPNVPGSLPSFSETPGPLLLEPRMFHTQVTLADGRILIAGGVSSAGLFSPVHAGAKRTTEIVSKDLTEVVPGPDMVVTRVGHGAFLLPDGTVLIAAGLGTNGRASQIAEIYVPAWAGESLFEGTVCP